MIFEQKNNSYGNIYLSKVSNSQSQTLERSVK